MGGVAENNIIEIKEQSKLKQQRLRYPYFYSLVCQSKTFSTGQEQEGFLVDPLFF